MYSVGVLSGEVMWTEVLARALKASGSTVSGWVNPAEAGAPDTHRLIDFSDLIWIPRKIGGGMEEAIQVIRRSRHLSLGFPVVEFIDEAPAMVKLAHEAHVQVQVGHSDWYHPAVRSTLPYIDHPQFIRFTEYLPDLPPSEGSHLAFRRMVADLDLALGLAGSPVRKVRPHASRLWNGLLVQAEIHIELHNGAVISLDLRKFSGRTERYIEMIQPGSHLGIDLAGGSATLTSFREDISGPVPVAKRLWPPAEESLSEIIKKEPHEEDAARQCLSFIHALERGRHSLSGLEGGFRALEMTRQIESHLGAL
jgi:predicted dehydrogenase